MPDDRHNFLAGGCFFLTVNLLDRRSDLLAAQVDVLRNAVRRVQVRAPFTIDAWVVLPDHMHCLWTLPEGDADFQGAGGRSRRRFRRRCRVRECRATLWLGVEHTIRDARDYAAHMDYTHFNPAKHGYVPHPADWPYSSFRRWMAAGLYAPGWMGGGDEPVEAGRRGPMKGKLKRAGWNDVFLTKLLASFSAAQMT